jgi:PIN domain-containing protein
VRKRRSKRQSDTSNELKKQLKSIVFFIDRSLNSPILIKVLREASAQVKPHSENYKPRTPDVKWIREVSEKRWVILKKDKQIKYNLLERTTLLRAKARAFVLNDGEITANEYAAIIIKALPDIIHTAKNCESPFLAKIYRDSSVKIWIPEGRKIPARE